MRRSDLLPVLTGLFAASVVMTNATSANLISVGPFVFVAGTLLYPATFLCTDLISELFGEEAATRAVWTGFAAQVFAVFAIFVMASFPSMDPEIGSAWAKVFTPVWRISLASMCAYLVAQHIDVRIYHSIKHRTGGRHLWLRNNLSTIASQGIDSGIFVLVAFFGVLDAGTLLSMWAGQYAAKAILAALDTPLCYAGLAAARRLASEEPPR